MVFSAATLIFLPLLWLVLFGIRMMLDKDEDTYLGDVVLRFEPAVRPWVMCHIWAASLILIYYIVTSRNKAAVEVCAKIPERPIGLVAIMCMGMGTYALLAFAKFLTKPAHAPTQKMPSLPGGALVWLGGPMVTMAACILALSTHGPMRPPAVSNVQDINHAFSKMLPKLNNKFYNDIMPGYGDCKAFSNYELQQGASMQSCAGSQPIASHEQTMGGHKIAASALWASGLNTLELLDVVVESPGDAMVGTQLWYMNIRGVFRDLHIYMQVLVDGKAWYKDYICCDQTFHFTLQVSVPCQPGIGFGTMQLNLLHMDKIDTTQQNQIMAGPAETGALDIGTIGLPKLPHQAASLCADAWEKEPDARGSAGRPAPTAGRCEDGATTLEVTDPGAAPLKRCGELSSRAHIPKRCGTPAERCCRPSGEGDLESGEKALKLQPPCIQGALRLC